MHKLSRSLLFAGFAAFAGLTACDDTEGGSGTVTPTPQVTGVTVTPLQAELTVGQTITLVATVNGDAGITNRTVTWSSNNTSIATVNPTTGLVTAVAAGQTTIVARSNLDNAGHGCGDDHRS
jgi:uncharacterized protein YjdB